MLYLFKVLRHRNLLNLLHLDHNRHLNFFLHRHQNGILYLDRRGYVDFDIVHLHFFFFDGVWLHDSVLDLDGDGDFDLVGHVVFYFDLD